ncbi:MAG: trehalose-phosphatase [Pseudomonadota bacterium]
MRPPPLKADRHALFLDFDGTLVDFAQTPDGISVGSELKHLLVKLEGAFDGALAFVTGRAAHNLAGHLGVSFLIAGSHGAELSEKDGTRHSLAHSNVAAELEQARAFQKANPAIVMEEKAGGLTLHFRRQPELKEKTLDFLQALFAGHDQIEIIAGALMWEVREKGLDKGSAIKTLLTRPIFQNRIPVFIGDDVTDEDGFRAVNAVNGVSVKVGPGETSARMRLPDIASVHTWLTAAITESAA